MVSVLDQRSPSDMVGDIIARGIQQNFAPGFEKGYERQLGLNALNKAESDIAQANKDPYKIAMAFARAGAQNPNLERSLGPLLQTAMQGAKTKNAYPNQNGSQANSDNSSIQPGQNNQNVMEGKRNPIGSTVPKITDSKFATPGPFNKMTPEEIDVESERYANAINDPNGFGIRQSQLVAQNEIADQQRLGLEDSLAKVGVSAEDMPRAMQVGSQFDPRNPSEWTQKTKRAFDQIKSNDKKLEKAFIPGIGSALLGRDRQKILDNEVTPIVQDMVENGLEQEARKFLAGEYLSPTEVEYSVHPLTPQKSKAIDSLLNGVFPHEDEILRDRNGFVRERVSSPFISYEEALERAPEQIQKMQDRLSDFFLKNVDDKTSLLVLRDKLWNEKDYDWRQIGPAIKEAQQKGLVLNPLQSTEMADILQPPIQSLPHIFRDFDRVIQYYRGNK